MQFLVPGLIVLIALSAFAGLKARPGLRRAACGRYSVDRLKSMSREEVRSLLDRVLKSEEPEPTFGAMCYEAVALPSTADYVCPVCGERTVYSADEAAMILYELPATRRLFEELVSATELDLTLDEAGFCSACSGTDASPVLVLRVAYDDGTVVSSEVGEMDLRLLTGLLSGQLTYSTFNEGTEPLRPSLQRLCEILGVLVKVGDPR
jgi:hypothetical protein